MPESTSASTDWTGSICAVGETDIHYRRSGGDLPSLIALHGLLGSSACLLPLGRALCEKFDVILPDSRGHGASSAPAKGYHYDDLSDDVLGLIAELRLAKPVLVGHSMGGMTAAVAAARLDLSFAALVLVDPTFISLAWQREVFDSGLRDEHLRLLASTKPALVAEARAKHPRRSPELLEALAEARLKTSLAAFDVLTPPNPDYESLVRALNIPTLLIVADKGVVSIDTARRLERANPHLRHEVIAEVGHGIPYDKPGQVAAMILAFACEIAGQPRSV